MIDTYQPLRIFSSEEYQLRKTQALLNCFSHPMLYISPTQLTPFIVRRVKAYDGGNPDWYRTIDFTIIKAVEINIEEEIDLTGQLYFDYGVRSDLELTNQIYDYAMYSKKSTISELPYGRYQLYFKDEDDNEFWSEVFKIWYPRFTVKFEYRNSSDINDLWFYDEMFYEMIFKTTVYSTGEYEEYEVTLLDEFNHDVYTLRRKDEILACNIFADSKILGALNGMQLCDTIYVTDEVGQRKKVEITKITPNDVSQGHHVGMTIRFRVPGNMLKSTDNLITWIGAIEGETPIISDDGIYRGRAKIYRGSKRIIRKSE